MQVMLVSVICDTGCSFQIGSAAKCRVHMTTTTNKVLHSFGGFLLLDLFLLCYFLYSLLIWQNNHLTSDLPVFTVFAGATIPLLIAWQDPSLRCAASPDVSSKHI